MVGVLVYQLQKLPALGDSGFYLGQAKNVTTLGQPKYALANFRSAAIAGLVMNLITMYGPTFSNLYSTMFVLPGFVYAGRGGGFKE